MWLEVQGLPVVLEATWKDMKERPNAKERDCVLDDYVMKLRTVA